VTLTSSGGAYCSGSAIDDTHILSAGHCVAYGLDTVTIEGYASPIQAIAMWPEIDTALYETSKPMNLATYATPGDFSPLTTAQLYGSCRLANHAGRLVTYTGGWVDTPYCSGWRVAMTYSCSGDSGGPVTQDGRVVGMMVRLVDWQTRDDMSIGNQLCIVPATMIQKRLVMWRSEDQ